MRALTQNNFAIDGFGITSLDGVVRLRTGESRSVLLRGV